MTCPLVYTNLLIVLTVKHSKTKNSLAQVSDFAQYLANHREGEDAAMIEPRPEVPEAVGAGGGGRSTVGRGRGRGRGRGSAPRRPPEEPLKPNGQEWVEVEARDVDTPGVYANPMRILWTDAIRLKMETDEASPADYFKEMIPPDAWARMLAATASALDKDDNVERDICRFIGIRIVMALHKQKGRKSDYWATKSEAETIDPLWNMGQFLPRDRFYALNQAIRWDEPEPEGTGPDDRDPYHPIRRLITDYNAWRICIVDAFFAYRVRCRQLRQPEKQVIDFLKFLDKLAYKLVNEGTPKGARPAKRLRREVEPNADDIYVSILPKTRTDPSSPPFQ